MAHPTQKPNCQHCKRVFHPDHRNVTRQRFCSKPACRHASKVDSQRRWRQKPDNLDYFKGSVHVERVQQWRREHPGYWRRPTPKVSKTSDALQETLRLQEMETQTLREGVEAPEAGVATPAQDALQDSFFLQPTVLVGLIAQLSGLALQEDIAPTWPGDCNNWGATFSMVHLMQREAPQMHKRPISWTQLRHVPRQFSWVDQRLVRERYIDRLTPEACALYLFLVTVADAQGLSYYADRSLSQRLPLAAPLLRQARQALIEQGLVAYRRPLYQVLALGAPEPGPADDPTAEDDAVDIQAVFQQIWEVLS